MDGDRRGDAGDLGGAGGVGDDALGRGDLRGCLLGGKDLTPGGQVRNARGDVDRVAGDVVGVDQDLACVQAGARPASRIILVGSDEPRWSRSSKRTVFPPWAPRDQRV